MWTLKHEIILPKFYELLIKIELKGETNLNFNNICNHTKISLNAFETLKEDFLPPFNQIYCTLGTGVVLWGNT